MHKVQKLLNKFKIQPCKKTEPYQWVAEQIHKFTNSRGVCVYARDIPATYLQEFMNLLNLIYFIKKYQWVGPFQNPIIYSEFVGTYSAAHQRQISAPDLNAFAPAAAGDDAAHARTRVITPANPEPRRTICHSGP